MDYNRGVLFLVILQIVWIQGESIDSIEPDQAVDGIEILCNHGEELCDKKCFDPLTQTCQENPLGYKVPCSSSEIVCGWECLSTENTSLACVDNQICEAGHSVCSAQCYSPETHQCLNNYHLCAIGEVECGYYCYNPDDKSTRCYEFEYSSYLCKANEKTCGTWGCYDPEIQKCNEEQERLCPIDGTICGFDCASKARGEICVDNKQVCKVGEALCGYRCYDPSSGEVCHIDNLVCRVEEKLCGTQGCYDPVKGQSCHNVGDSYHVVCESGLHYCHFNCYDQQKEECLQPNSTSPYKMICPKGHAACNKFLQQYDFGYECYNPAVQACISNSQGTILCEKGQKTCGRTCYNAEDFDGNHCFEKVGVICKPDEDVCGSICYNKATKKCIRS